MAVTGIIWVAYLITHVLANLLVFQGPGKINAYSAFLHGTGGALWAARLVLIAALVLHVVAAVQLTDRRQEARPVGLFRRPQGPGVDLGARTIRWGGALILVFLVYHILHFTIGTAHPSFVEGNPYHNVATGFRSPAVVAIYLVAMAVVGLHLYHGVWSSGRSLGVSPPIAPATPPRSRARTGAARLAGLLDHSDCGLRGSRAMRPLDPRVPGGPIEQKWDQHRFEMKLVNPANKRKYTVLMVGSGLAGASAAATLSELGYNVKCFCFQDSPRRAHSIAAQGGINAAKNYRNDGDSIYRLFYDTVKGGDFRSREANVYRLAQISVEIIDQCVAQGVPFAREYGGLLANRSFGGAQVSRTFYARGQTGQQLLLGAYQQMEKEVARGRGHRLSPDRDARPDRGRRSGPRYRRPRHGDRADLLPPRRCGGAGHRRLRQRLLSLDQRQGLQRHRHLAGPQAGRGVCQPVLHRCRRDSSGPPIGRRRVVVFGPPPPWHFRRGRTAHSTRLRQRAQSSGCSPHRPRAARAGSASGSRRARSATEAFDESWLSNHPVKSSSAAGDRRVGGEFSEEEAASVSSHLKDLGYIE